MSSIYIAPLSAVEDAIEEVRPSHLISLLDPETMIDTPSGIARERHLQLGINDISTPSDYLVAPDVGHIDTLLAFVDGWHGDAPLLVHCWAGISRSTAAAFIALCAINETAAENDLARLIRDRGDHAHPNRLMVQLADQHLGREGRMTDAVEALGPGRMTWEGTLFSVPARPDI